MRNLKIISADSHADEPAELYERLPEEYRRRAPRTMTIEGREYSILEGQRPRRVDIARKRLTEEDKRREFRVEGREGGSNIPLRLADLDEDGVSAEVIYPQGLFKIAASPDPGYKMAFARLYNDWYHSVFHEHPDKFVPSAVIPMADISMAIDEATRVVKMGFRSLSVPVSVPSLPYNRPDYEPFWALVEEMRVPLGFHVFTSGSLKPEDLGEENSHGGDLAFMSLGMAEAMSPLALLTGAGVLQNHPNLRIVLAECGIGWLAWFLRTLDEVYEKRHMWQSPKLHMMPSEFWKRQGYVTFGKDEVGLRNRDITGVDCLMWGSDYPHDEGTFPHSREVIAEIFRDLPEEEIRKIVGLNAAKLYGFPLD